MFPILYIFSDWAIFALRVIFGVIFVVHGWPKIKDLKMTSQSFLAMGFRPGIFWSTLVAVVEFFGGIALILGLYTQIAAGLLVVQFIVINIWKVAKRQPFVGGVEFDLLLLAAALALSTLGAGALSLDKFFFLGGF